MSVAICFSASVSFARFVEPSVSVYVVVTVWRPLITTIRESCVRFVLLERLSDALKLGLPVIVVSLVQL